MNTPNPQEMAVPELTDQHREIATELVLDHAREIVEHLAEREIDDPDGDLARAVHNMAMNAAVTVDLDTDDPAVIDAAHLDRQRAFSERTFGPGRRAEGVLDHIRKELVEIEAAPDDLGEWVDVAILALDGAWRAGHEPQQIIDAIVAKQARNEARKWPDWRTAEPGKAIEHDRSADVKPRGVTKWIN